MAWRIDEYVIRGEIDNRTRGHTTGRIWFEGRAEPVELELRGNCWRDLAGRRLEFINPQPKPGPEGNFAAHQVGAVGDITASRKVRVPDIPLDQLHLYYKTGREMPWHWGNSLYLEWFSEFNGRVVIESAAFELRIAGEPAWEMTEAEEEAQKRANAVALGDFMARLGEAVARSRERVEKAESSPDQPAGEEEWDQKPETEEEAEARQARSDLLNDRIAARMEREGDDADLARIIDEELDRLRRERGEPEPTPEDETRNAEWIEEMNAAAADVLASPDPELEAELDYDHPLVMRARELSHRLHDTAETENWLPADAGQEHPVRELLDATMIVGGKLAGALNGRDWPPGLDFCASTIVRLKRAHSYLDDALRAAESCQEEKLITATHLGPVVVELNDLVHDTDALIAELRAKLERGTD